MVYNLQEASLDILNTPEDTSDFNLKVSGEIKLPSNALYLRLSINQRKDIRKPDMLGVYGNKLGHSKYLSYCFRLFLESGWPCFLQFVLNSIFYAQNHSSQETTSCFSNQGSEEHNDNF